MASTTMKGKKDAPSSNPQEEMMNMMRGLQSTLGGFDAKFKQQGDKIDNVISGQNEVKAAVKNFESKLESVEK